MPALTGEAKPCDAGIRVWVGPEGKLGTEVVVLGVKSGRSGTPLGGYEEGIGSILEELLAAVKGSE